MATIILITGASSGFGKAIAEKFASEGYDLIITGRRKELLLENSDELKKKYDVKVLPLNFDVRDKKAVYAAMESLPETWKRISVVVNNAGLALGRDYFEEADMEDWETMIDTNLKGLLYTTRAALPMIINTGKGHIINLGSIAGRQVYEKGNVYCATKHAVAAISDAMRIDLLRHKIKVTAIHPGAAETEFSEVRFKGDKETAKSVYKGYKPLQAADVADVVFYCASLPEHVCINDLTITPLAQANAFYLNNKS